MPLHPVALEVLSETGPMAVSCANRTGPPPAVTAAEAREQLGYSVAAYLEAGPLLRPDARPRSWTAPDRCHGSCATGDPVERLREVVPDIEPFAAASRSCPDCRSCPREPE